MVAGARKIVAELCSSGKLDAIVSLGGSTAAATGASVMQGLPIGLPKLLITTFMSLVPVGDEDVAVMQSPVDLVGLNKILIKTLSNAAAAIVGMVEQPVSDASKKRLVGITALGVTTPAIQHVIPKLAERGYDSVAFHATSDKLDRMARDGVIDAIFDLTTFETVPRVIYSDEQLSMLPGSGRVDRSRLSWAGRERIPQIIAPGGLDMHIFPGATGPDSAPPGYGGRAWTRHGPTVLLVRTSERELEEVGSSIAARANSAAGPVAIVVPVRGFSEASRKDAPLWNPQADRSFIRSLKASLESRIPMVEVDCNINDEPFAEAVMRTFDEIRASGEVRR